jgi:hypothetical protein
MVLNYSHMADKSPAQQIDDIIKMHPDWHGEVLARLRSIIMQAGPALVEEVKWKKPSRTEGVPVWSHEGNVCIGETLKNAVRLTFPKGASLKDPTKLFNTRLDSKTIRAIDFHGGDTVDETALQALIRDAAELNAAKAK